MTRASGPETWMEGKRYVNFASYDYLGLSQHSAVQDAAKSAIERFGTSRIGQPNRRRRKAPATASWKGRSPTFMVSRPRSPSSAVTPPMFPPSPL